MSVIKATHGYLKPTEQDRALLSFIAEAENARQVLVNFSGRDVEGYELSEAGNFQYNAPFHGGPA